jgi:hypothetical protein
MSDAKKIVLVSTRGYDPSHDHILRDLIARKIVLFCAVGVECALWEDVMDELVVGPTGDGEHHVTTTSHPGESLAEVVEFARSWAGDEPTLVEVIEV